MRDAILQAADHLERNPSLLDFSQCNLNGDPQGCPLVWIARFAGATGRLHAFTDTWVIPNKGQPLDDGVWVFFGRMNQLGETINPPNRYAWMSHADICAKTLRAYADKYHPQAMRAAA